MIRGAQPSHEDGSAIAGIEAGLVPLPPERYDLRILSSLRRIIRSVDSYSRKLAVGFGITVPQLLCMLKLEQKGPLTIKELSEEVFLSASTLVGIVDRLERSGMLARERSTSDRRKVRLVLTQQGHEMVAKSPSPLQQSLVDAIERLPEEDRATIAESLENLVEFIDAPSLAGKDEPAAPVLEASEDLKATRDVSPNLESDTRS